MSLDIWENPSRTQRFHGKDRWTYIFYDQSIRFEKEIQFFEGNAIYIGDTWQPPEEQSAYRRVDKKNEAEKYLDRCRVSERSHRSPHRLQLLRKPRLKEPTKFVTFPSLSRMQ